MTRENERNNFSTQLNVGRAVREIEIVCVSKGIGERTSLAFREPYELIGKYDRSFNGSNFPLNFA
jgi:hypothetical protein